MSKMKLAAAAAVIALGFAGAANAALNVLWYSGGTEASGPGTYQTNINTLATPGVGDPSSATWNITYWTGGAMPTGSYNVLVVASPQGFWSTNPDYTALDGAASGITLGDRLMVTGQDADWHFQNSPGPTNFDGPRGFLRDSIDWAGDGTGLGLVVLGGEGSVLDAFGLTSSLGTNSGSTNTVDIPGAFASFPINTDLDSAGLSNWETSAHDIWFNPDTSVWTGINTDGGDGFVTLVSKQTAGGGISGGPGVPEPATWAMMLVGFGGLGALMRRRRLTPSLAA